MVKVGQLKEGITVLDYKGVEHEIIKVKKGGLLGVIIRLRNKKKDTFKTITEPTLNELYLNQKELKEAEKQRKQRVERYLKEKECKK